MEGSGISNDRLMRREYLLAMREECGTGSFSYCFQAARMFLILGLDISCRHSRAERVAS